jgi:hypothetical protein
MTPRVIKRLLVAAVVALAAYTDSLAGPLPVADTTSYATTCNPCTIASSNWNGAQVDTAAVPLNGCHFQVVFKRRYCGSDGCQELKILAIEPLNPIPCTAIPDDAVLQIVIGELVLKNLMGFFPDTTNGGQGGCWKIVKPRCWRKRLQPGNLSCLTTAGPLPSAIGTWVPCDLEDCCVNVIYPYVSACNTEYILVEPGAPEYMTILRAQSSGAGFTQTELDEMDKELAEQFIGNTCEECNDSPEPPTNPYGECVFFCSDSITKSYRKAKDQLLMLNIGY